MIVVLSADCGEREAAEVLALVERLGLSGRPLRCGGRRLIHVIGGDTRSARRLIRHERVDALIPTSGPRVRREGRRFYPYHLLAWSALFLALVGVLVFLAGSFPPGLGRPADPLVPPAELELPLYLRPLVAWIGLFPVELEGLAWLLLFALCAAVAAVPLADRSSGAGIRGRLRVIVPMAALVLAAMLLALRGGSA